MSNIRGRFNKPADKLAQQYTASLPFDQRLYKQDIDAGEDKVFYA
jgi:argininosuccinate lyase